MEHLDRSDFAQSGSHGVPLAKLSTGAQRRLRDIGKADVDELWSLRIQGKQRVWCIAFGNVMKALWWDPDHEVVPSNKKRT